MTQQVPDYAALGYDLVINIMTNVSYHEWSPLDVSTYEYKILGNVTATFLEKQADGTMKWLMVSMTGRHEIGDAVYKIENKSSTQLTVENLAAKYPATAVVPALTATIAPGVAKMKEELEKKE